MYAKKNSGKKILVTLLALVLVIGCTIGGTIAWLMDTSNSVVNTFTVGDITIELKEHKLDGDGNLTEGTANEVNVNVPNSYKIVPGVSQPKDPFVRFTENSEACWLFVKIDETHNTVGTKKFVSYDVDGAWQPLNGVAGVYYMELDDGAAAATVKNILDGKTVSYDSTLTKEEIAAAKTNPPVLTFTAYAVQKEAATSAAAAWNLVKDNLA